MQPKRKRQITPKSKPQARKEGDQYSPSILTKERREMQEPTLRKFLLAKRVELYEKVNIIKDKILSENFNERDERDLEVAEAELNLVKSVIEICVNRGNKF